MKLRFWQKARELQRGPFPNTSLIVKNADDTPETKKLREEVRSDLEEMWEEAEVVPISKPSEKEKVG